MFTVDWEPRFVEEAVLRAAETRQLMGFRVERNRLYEIREPEERDAAFRAFHAVWFERLELGRAIWQALQEQPLILTQTRACIVVHSRGSREEGAELFVSPGREGTGDTERRSVGIRLDPRRLLDEERLLTFLRHELLHIADMLDPTFGYEPRLPEGGLGPAHERLVQDRYRVLWDIYIDGRMVHRNWAPPKVRDHRFQEFAKTFPMLSDRLQEVFSHFFECTSRTHDDLVLFASNPRAFGDSHSEPRPLAPDPRPLVVRPQPPTPGTRPQYTVGERCPLCGFPTYSFEPNPDQLPAEVLARIQAERRSWTPSQGLCRQCSDLYRARSLSTAHTS